MKRLLVILFLLSAFLFYSYAGQEEEKAKVVVIDPGDTSMIYDWPLWLFNHGYTSSYDSNWMDDYYYTRRRPGAIVLRQPPSFLESFLDGFGKGISRSVDYYYRKKEQDRHFENTLKLFKLLSNQPIRYATGEEVAAWFIEDFEKKEEVYSKAEHFPHLPDEDDEAFWNRFDNAFDKHWDEREARWQKANENLDRFIEKNGMRYKDKREFLNKYQFFLAEQSGEIEDNWKRIKELDRIIKLKKERASLDKLFREAGWLDKDRIEYLDKYYPLPLTEGYPPLPEGYRLVRPRKKEEDDIVKFARSQGAMLPGEYKMKKLNEYLKSQNLPEVPLAFEVDKLFHGGWVIYWDGEKWARKKKE